MQTNNTAFFLVFRRPPSLFFYLSEKVQLRRLVGGFLAGHACLHGIHTHSVSPNKGRNHKDWELWELIPSRWCLVGWAANAAGNTRGAKQCQTLPRKCSGIHELTSLDWAEKRAGLKGGPERSNRSGCLKRKEKVRMGNRSSGWEAKPQKKPEPRPRCRIISLAHQNPLSFSIFCTWQKTPRLLKIGCIGFLQSFVSGPINLHQLFT